MFGFSAFGTQALGTVNDGIQFNAVGTSGDQAAASSYSGAAVWNGNNRFLAVDVSMLGAGVTVTAMTYGGANCTLIGVKSTVTSFGRVECWGIKSSDSGAPAAGSNTLVVTLSGSLEFVVEWVSYKEVNQTTPTEAFNSAQATNSGSATDASVVITSITDNAWIHAAVVANDTSITANQTSRNNIAGTLGSGGNEDNNSLVHPGAVTMSYTGMGITATWAIAGYAIRPYTAKAVPNAPTIGTATAGNALATVTYTESTDNGGVPITGHTATSTPGSFTGTGASPITVNGLSNGTAYTFTVHSTNAIGNSPESAASNSVTPTGGGSFNAGAAKATQSIGGVF